MSNISKEINILKKIQFSIRCIDCNSQSQKSALEEIEKLKQLLTPPTEQDVCKDLSLYLGDPIEYADETFFTREKELCIVAKNDEDLLIFNTDLPPLLITLIGRFYEGLSE